MNITRTTQYIVTDMKRSRYITLLWLATGVAVLIIAMQSLISTQLRTGATGPVSLPVNYISFGLTFLRQGALLSLLILYPMGGYSSRQERRGHAIVAVAVFLLVFGVVSSGSAAHFLFLMVSGTIRSRISSPLDLVDILIWPATALCAATTAFFLLTQSTQARFWITLLPLLSIASLAITFLRVPSFALLIVMWPMGVPLVFFIAIWAVVAHVDPRDARILLHPRAESEAP